MLRHTNVLTWLATAPDDFGRFLRECAARGHADVLERAVLTAASPVCLELSDSKGRTSLHCAARRGHLVTLNRMLDWGANARATTVRGDSLLHILAAHPPLLGTALQTKLKPLQRTRGLGAAQIDYLRRKASAAAVYIGSLAKSSSSKSASHEQLPTTASDANDTDDDQGDDGDGESEVTQPLARSWGSSVPQLPSPTTAPSPSTLSSPPTAATTTTTTTTTETDPGALVNAAVPKIEELVRFTVRRLCQALDPSAINADGWTPLRLAIEHGNDSVARFLRECGAQMGEEPPVCDSIVEVEVPSSPPPPSMSSPPLQTTMSLSTTPEQQDQQTAETTATTPRTGLSAAGASIARVASKVGHSVAESSQSMAAAVRRLKQDAKTEYIRKVREIIDSEPRKTISRLPTGSATTEGKYRIISLDGGGVRCVMHCIILARIAQRFPGFLDNTEMFCGCSGAAPIAVCLLSGLSVGQVGKLIELSAETTLRKAQGNGITGVKYTSKWLRLMCDVLMGDLRLKDLPRHVVIPTYRLDNGLSGDQRKGEALFATNAGNGSVCGGSEERAVDACMRSGSAPTYFRCYQGYVDGGVFANNPSMCALPIVVGSRPQGLGVNAENVVCLSLGTGFAHKQFIEDSKVIEGGLYQWGTQLFDVYNTAQLDFADVAGRATLGSRYWRHMPALPSQIRLDNVKSIPVLKDIAWKLNIDDLLAWVERNWC